MTTEGLWIGEHVFHREGADRTDRENRLVAAFLASIAGFVNSASFLLVGAFTSHVTGNVGRLANDVALGQPLSAVTAFVLIAAFFVGAFLASMAIESQFFGRPSRTYGVLMVLEAAILVAFIALVREGATVAKDMPALLLCGAMGLQNSLVTRLSGAVVRTTHLTGVVTDIGIEAARWFRYARRGLGRRVKVTLSIGPSSSVRPSTDKMTLLLTITGTFVSGSLLGAFVTSRVGKFSLILPALALAVAGAYGVAAGKALPDERD